MTQQVVPKLRGWFHLGATPAVIIASLVLFILSKNSFKFAVALYSITAILLFSVSAIYHRVPWSPEKKKIWRRFDHANINLLIAGSYTPFAVTLLHGRDRTILLSVIWIGALVGVAVRMQLVVPRLFFPVQPFCSIQRLMQCLLQTSELITSYTNHDYVAKNLTAYQN